MNISGESDDEKTLWLINQLVWLIRPLEERDVGFDDLNNVLQDTINYIESNHPMD